MTEHKPELITAQINNKYYDYSPEWYADVGQKLFQTMMIQSFLPYVKLTTGFVIPRLKALLDNDFTGDVYKTKCTALAQYINLYSGEDYVIHFKYSTVLNVVYITMMYGVGMPMLFPLAAFNFFNQWITERIIVAYQVRLPPALDDKLTNNCISMLKGAPLMLLFNGYWMISNRQIFTNGWSYKQRSFDTMKSGHMIQLEVNWATPMLLLAAAAVLIIIIQIVFKDMLMKFGFSMSSKKIEVDEDLPRFFEAIKLSQADELIDEQFNMKKNYGFIPNDPDTIQELDRVKVPRKAIQGTPWYQILSNQAYAQKFFYIGAHVEEREKIIEDGFVQLDDPQYEAEQNMYKYEQSDMIMILLNLAYIPDDVVQQIQDFEPGWSTRFKQSMTDYKNNFNLKVEKKEVGKHGILYDTKWRYQGKVLEQRYAEFMKMRDGKILEKKLEAEKKKLDKAKGYQAPNMYLKDSNRNGSGNTR